MSLALLTSLYIENSLENIGEMGHLDLPAPTYFYDKQISILDLLPSSALAEKLALAIAFMIDVSVFRRHFSHNVQVHEACSFSSTCIGIVEIIEYYLSTWQQQVFIKIHPQRWEIFKRMNEQH